MANRFLSNISINDAYTLPASDGTSGQVITTDGSGNLSFSDVTFADGARSNFVYYDVKNSSGSTINKGTAVMATGTDGNSGHVLIAPMVADGSVEPRYFMGVLETTLLNGEIGKVVHFGQISQLNTTAFADGDILWCDPANAGGFTVTEPLGPNLKIAAAIVISSATNGKIKVRVQGNAGLHELHDVKLVSEVNGDLLQWNGTVWENKSLATIADSRYVNVSGDTMTGNLTIGSAANRYIRFSTDTNWYYYLSAINDDFYIKDVQDVNFFKAVYNGGGTGKYAAILDNIYVFNGGNVGIAKTTDVDYKLDVFGDGRFNSGSSEVPLLLTTSSTNGTILGLVSTSGGTQSWGINAYTNGNLYFQNGTIGSGTNAVYFTSAGAANFSSSVTANSFVKSSGTSSQFLKADGSVDSNAYLTTSGKAADSELLDGIDSSRVIYGDNSTGTSYISAATLDTALKSGFYTTDGGVPNATSVNFVLHNAYYGVGNLAGFDLACNDTTASSFYLRPATGAGKGAWQTIITSANIGNQSVNYAAGAGNASTLDTLDSSQFLRSDESDTMGGDLTVTGNISHNGLTMTSGSDIDQITQFTKSLQLVANTWMDTGISGNDIGSNGVYIIYMFVHDYDVGGGHYSEIYSGVMSWHADGTNDPQADEIYLHRAGHAPSNGGVIQLRTLRQYNASGGVMKLQIKSDKSYSAADGIVFKFRRMI